MQPHPDVPTAQGAPPHPLADTAPAGCAEVRAVGGAPRALLPRTYAELPRTTGGTPVEVA